MKTRHKLINILLQVLILMSFVFGAVSTFAEENHQNQEGSKCEHLYPSDMLFERVGYKEICNEFFVVVYDQTINGVRFTSELVHPQNTYRSEHMSFKKDKRLAVEHSPESYASVEYDRGHMVPAANATTKEALEQTYLMSNIVPQDPHLNRGAWRDLERRVKRVALATNEAVRVVTIAHYDTSIKKLVNIAVPRAFEKRIYTKPMLCYYAENTPYARVSRKSCQD